MSSNTVNDNVEGSPVLNSFDPVTKACDEESSARSNKGHYNGIELNSSEDTRGEKGIMKKELTRGP